MADPDTPPTTLVGGVGQLFQGDLDLGREVVERLAREPLPPGVVVEDLFYGAIAVSQLLEELAPDALVLVGSKRRHRPVGTIECRRLTDLDLDVGTIQTSVADSAVGYVDLDLVIDVAWGFGTLPERTVVIEVEPAALGPGEGLSSVVEARMAALLDTVRDEVERLGRRPAGGPA